MKLDYTSYEYYYNGSLGTAEVKKKLDDLRKYLTFERKQSMSRYEVRLYDWILKKQYKANPIDIVDWIEEIDPITYNTHKQIGGHKYYLGYYIPTCKLPMHQEDEYTKEQQKLRSRFHSKMGR